MVQLDPLHPCQTAWDHSRKGLFRFGCSFEAPPRRWYGVAQRSDSLRPSLPTKLQGTTSTAQAVPWTFKSSGETTAKECPFGNRLPYTWHRVLFLNLVTVLVWGVLWVSSSLCRKAGSVKKATHMLPTRTFPWGTYFFEQSTCCIVDHLLVAMTDDRPPKGNAKRRFALSTQGTSTNTHL